MCAIRPLDHRFIISNERKGGKVVRIIYLLINYFGMCVFCNWTVQIRYGNFQEFISPVFFNKPDSLSPRFLFFFRISKGSGMKKPETTQLLWIFFSKGQRYITAHTMTN